MRASLSDEVYSSEKNEKKNIKRVGSYDALHVPEKIEVLQTRDNLIFITQSHVGGITLFASNLRQNTCVCVCLVLLEFKDDDLKGKRECKNA